MAEPSVLQKKTEIFLERDIYPLLKNFPASEKFSLCQEIKQSCYKLIRAAVMANNLCGHGFRCVSLLYFKGEVILRHVEKRRKNSD